MKVEFISIGDELLIGQTINTNVTWLGREFSERGFFIEKITTIKDTENAITNALHQSVGKVAIVIITGGLGPTKDDITKKVLCDYFNDELYIDEATLQQVKSFFEKVNRPMLDVNIQQAAVPKSCVVLPNKQGTAPGMWFEKENTIVISLPGVPYEMKGIMLDEVFPRIEQIFQIQKYYSKTGNIQGVGESFIADKMKNWENSLRNEGLELAYLPSPGLVRLRISSKNGIQDKSLIDGYFQQLEENYPLNFYGYGEKTLPIIIGDLLKKCNQTVVTAESCTGGAIGASITSIQGASAYFLGGFIVYTNDLKSRLLGVDNSLFETKGAVSEEVVIEMANGCKKVSNADYCIAISGIAGPDGGTEEKPVGTVWIAIASPKRTIAQKFSFGDNRERNIQKSVLSALNMLRVEILKFMNL